MTLLSASACSPATAAIDRYLLPTGRSAANRRLPLLLSNDGTDGRTPDSYIDLAPLFTVYVFTVYYCVAACWRNKGW